MGMNLRRIVREVLSEVFETTHSLNRVRDRIMDKIYFTVGYEDRKSPLGYVIVGKYYMRDNIRARIMNNLDTIKNYDYSTNVEYAIKIGYVEVDRRNIKFINDELRVNSLGKMLFVIDEDTKSIGRDIYAIIAKNKIITIMFNNDSSSFRSQKKIVVTNPRELESYRGVTPVVNRNQELNESNGQGKKILAYHVSENDFDVFDKSKIGSSDNILHRKKERDKVGFFFTTSEWDVNEMISVLFRYKKKPIVYICELSFNNPYTLEDLDKLGFINNNAQVDGWNVYDLYTKYILTDVERLKKDAIYFNKFAVVFEPAQIKILSKQKFKKGEYFDKKKHLQS